MTQQHKVWHFFLAVNQAVNGESMIKQYLPLRAFQTLAQMFPTAQTLIIPGSVSLTTLLVELMSMVEVIAV